MSEFLNGFIEKLQKAQDTSSDPKTVVADTLRARGITDPQELANVLAQIEVETNYQPRSEDARYSAKRLFELYGAGNKHKNKARFKTIADAQKVVSAGPEAIFDTIYGGRMGNAPNEGHKYRGRGYIQLTGKNNYKYYGEKIGKDLVNNPDLANDPAVAAEIAAVYFLDAKARGTNLADIDATTKAIGAGDKSSYARRKQAAERLFAELGAPGKPKAPAPSPGRFNPDLLGQPDVAPAPQREAPRFQLPEFTPPDLPQVDLAPAADAIFNFVRDNANPLSRAQAQTPAPTAVTSPAQKPKTPPISTKVTFERTAPKTAARPPAPRERRDLGVYNQAGAVSEFIAANPDVYGLAKSISTANDPEIETYETAPGDFADAISRGWDSGLVQMGSDAQYAAAALEFGLGDPEKGRVALSKARMLEERNARIIGLTPGLDDLLDEPSIDGFFSKVGVTLGQVGPSIFASVAGAVAGGAMGMATAGPVGAGAGGVGGGVTTAAMQLGARKVTIKAIERMAKDAAKKKAMGRTLNEPEQKILEGAYQAIREARGAGFKRGAVAGALATEYPTMTGASFREFTEAGVDIEDPNYGRASLAIGAPLAAVGVFGEKLILEGALEIAQKKLSRQQTNSMLKIVVEDITKLGVKGGVTEGLTETAQEGALITQRLAVDPDYSMDEASLRIAESAFAGFIAGGAVGGASGAFTGAGRSMNYEAPLTADQFRGFGDSLGGVVNDFPLGPPPGLPPTIPETILRNNTYTEQDKAAASRVLEVGKRYADSLEAGAFADAAAEIDEMKAQLATMTGKALPTYKETANFVKQAEISLRAAQRRANPTENLMGRAREMLDKTRGVQAEAAMDAEATGARADGPAQEPVADFEAQFEYIRTVEDSPKKSMWVPANSVYQPNFAGRTDLSPFTLYSDAGLYAAYIPGEGTIISRSEAAVAAVIVAARTSGNVEAALADALGYSNVKTEDADRVVRVVDGEGRVVSEEATDALNEQDAVARAQAIADAGFGYTVDVKPVEDALVDRRDRFEGEDDAIDAEFTEVDDNGDPIVRNMRSEDVNNFKSGPQFDAAVAVGEDVGIPIRTKKGAESYAPADPAQRKIPKDIFDARLGDALEKVDEGARQTFIDNADNMSDSALEGLERAVEQYPDDFIYMTVEQDDAGQDRVFIKRTPRTFGRGDIEKRRAELLPQLEALARETPYDKANKRPRPIGTGGVTPITMVAPDGKVSRPNMWRLAVIGGKLNGIESISDVFPLGEKPSPAQVASMSIQRAVTELLELGYRFEISYLDGTLDGKRASRPLQLSRRDYAPLPGWQNFPPLKDQVLVRRRSASGQTTQFTYDEIINAGQPQVEQKDSAAVRIERYKEGPRKRSEARLARKWMQMRNAALRAYPNMTPAEQASATERFGDMSNKTDLKAWPDQIELANAYVDERLAQQDAAFMQRLRDQDLAFDPNDIDTVKDADRELAFQTAQAYLQDNPDDQQQYEDRAEADAGDMVDETVSEFIDVAPDGDIDAALAMDLPATVREALTDYPELVTVEHIRTLKTAQRDGVLSYMYARPQRSKTRRDGARAIVGIDIIQGRIPKAQRTAEFNSSLRGLIAALDGLQPAGALTAFRDFISPEQLDRWWKIIEGGAPLSKLHVEKGLGGIVRMARPVRPPGEETAPADLFRTVIETQKDPAIKELDAAVKDRVVDDTQRRATALANKLEAAKRALKEIEQGTPQYDAKRAEIRQLQADLTRLKQAMFGDQGRRAQSAGMSNTQPRAQTKTVQPTVNVRSPVSEFVSRAIGVAAGITKPGKPTDVFMASDFEARLPELIEQGFIPAAFEEIFRKHLAMFKSGRKTYGSMLARNRYIVLINDFDAAGLVDDAVMAATIGHEFGHIVFLDEFGDIEEGSKPHVPQLIAAYNDYANARQSEGKVVYPFEEWFSDQVAAYVYREAAGMEQKRSKDSKFKRGVDYTANNDYFASIARKLKNLFARVNALLRGRLDQSQQFVDWFEELIFVRKQNGPNNHNVLSAIAIRNMAAAANGALVPSPGGPQAQSTGPGSLTAQMLATINNMLKQFMADPGRVLKRTFYASEDYLRALGADDIAKFFYGRSQSKEELGFHRAKEFEQNRWFSALSDAIGIDRDNMTDAEIDQVLFEAEDNRIPTAQLSPKAKAVRQVFDDMYEKYISYYVRDSRGRLVQLRWFDVKKGQNYSPRQLNTAAIAKNPDAFAAWLVGNGYMTASEARNLAYELATYQDQIDPNQGNDPLGTPIMPHGKQRTLAFIPTTELRNARGPGADPTYGWILPPQLAMTRYIHFVTRKVEYERRGGKDALKSLVMALPEKDRDDAINMIEANLGKLGTDIAQRPAARFVNSVSQTATALTTLTFAVLSSLPDLAGVMIRAKDTSNFMDAFRQLRATLTDTENRDLARAVGVVTNQALDSVFMAPGEMDFTALWAKKIMEKFFQFNGTEAYTRFVRTFAAGMGREFLVNTAFGPNFGPRQERWLAELGLTRQDVIDWQQSPHFNQGDIERGVTLRGGAPGSLEHRIANAIARFSDEAIIRPNSAMKPGWASNPYFTIVWQLKSYFYAYGKVVMGGMFREFSTRVEEGDTRGAYAQLLLAAGAILPLTMIGLEARELIKYFARLAFPWIGDAEMALQTDRMDLGEYSFEIIDRSGMLGPWTLAISTYEGIEREGLIGPVAGNVPMVDMVDETVFDGDWSRAVPVVNNL